MPVTDFGQISHLILGEFRLNVYSIVLSVLSMRHPPDSLDGVGDQSLRLIRRAEARELSQWDAWDPPLAVF